MKKLIQPRVLGAVVTLFLMSIGVKVQATHLAGADISYKCINSLSFEVTLTVYRDCAGSGMPNGVTIDFSSLGCNINFSQTLLQVPGTGKEITYLCPSAATNCTNPLSPYKGIQKWEYRGVVNLPMQCNDWVIDWQYCCRNCDITTMTVASPCVPGTNPSFNIPAHLDNVRADCNTSPQFTNIPIVYVCRGQTFHYNHGAVDPDGDSLVFSWAPALVNSTDSIPYIFPFSSTNPLSSSPQATINPVTGDITFTPTQIEVGVLAVLVEEYRNGFLIGSVVRDMEVYVQNCVNNLPVASGINNGPSHDTSACPNTQVCFDVFSNDLDAGQNVTMTWNSGIPGATFTISGTTHPVGHFCWTPTAADRRATPHTFTVGVVDDACPNSGYQIFSYNIFVNSPLFGTSATSVSCNSTGDGMAIAFPVPGSGTLSYLWNTTPPSTNDTLFNLSAGTYLVTVVDVGSGCVGVDSVTVTSAPKPVVQSSFSTPSRCANDSSGTATVIVTGGTPSYSYLWDNGNITFTAINLNPGYHFVTITDSKGCIAIDSVLVNGPPNPVIANVSSHTDSLLCNGDSNGMAVAVGSGGNLPYVFQWYNNSVLIATNDTATNLPAGIYVVLVTDAIGCTSSDTSIISQPDVIQPSYTVKNVGCAGGNNGSILLDSISGGTPNYTYVWMPGNLTSSGISGLSPGSYAVTIKDAHNCTRAFTFTVGQNSLANVSAGNDSSLCDSTGVVALHASSPPPGFIGTWSSNPPVLIANPNDSNTTATGLSGTTIFTWTVTDGGPCTGNDQVTIAVVRSTDAGTDQTLCSFFTTLNAQPLPPGFSGQWTTPASGVLITPNNSNTTSVSGFPIGTTTFYWTITNGICTYMDSVSVNVITSIPVSAGSDLTICGTDSVILHGSLVPFGYIGTWVPSDSSVFIHNPNDSSTLVTLVNGTTTFVWIVGNGICVGSDPVKVVVVKSANAGNDQSLCTNSTQMNGVIPPPGFTGLWTTSSSATIVNPSSATSNVNGLPPGTSTFYWTITNGTCTYSDTVNVTSFSSTLVNAGNDSSYCGGTISVTLNGSTPPPGFTGVWLSSSPVAFNPGANDAHATVTGINGTITFTWVVTNGACLGSDTVNITVVGGASAGNDQSLCTNSAVLNASPLPTGFSGVWTTPSTAIISPITNPIATVSGLPTGTTPFYWTITNQNCTYTDTVNITAFSASSVNAGNDTSYCGGTTSLTLNASLTPPGFIGTWVSSDPNVVFIPNVNDPNATVGNIIGTTTFTWVVTNVACSGNDQVTITIVNATNAGTNQSLCTNTTQLNATAPPTGFTGTWTLLSGGGVIVTPTYEFSMVNGLSSGNNQFIWTITNGSCSYSDTVDIYSLPSSAINAGADTLLCGATSTTLHATLLPPGFTGIWTSSDPNVTINDPTNPITAVSGLPNGSVTFTWTITTLGCSISDQVVVGATTPSTSAGADTDVCGKQYTLSATPAPTGFIGTWTYNDPNVSISSTHDPFATVGNLPYNTPVLFTWTIVQGGCTGLGSVAITAYEPVTASADAYLKVCKPAGLLQAVQPTIGIGTWHTILGSGHAEDSLNNQTNAVNLSVGQNTFMWTVTNGACSASDTATLFYDRACILELPSGFTPNNDGPNDTYVIHGIEGYPLNYFSVYNRWGNIVYQKEDFANGDWDGQNKNDKPLPDGTYYVILEIKDSDIKRNTYVDLRR